LDSSRKAAIIIEEAQPRPSVGLLADTKEAPAKVDRPGLHSHRRDFPTEGNIESKFFYHEVGEEGVRFVEPNTPPCAPHDDTSPPL
jgi:hypothetical protein